MTPEEKQKELIRHRDILLATLDYFIERSHGQKLGDFDPVSHFKELKSKAEEHFKKGRLSTLKQWLRDVTEEPRETGDTQFGAYIKTKTGYDYDIFNTFEKTVNKIIKRKKIKSEDEYRDIMTLIDNLSQANPVDTAKIEMLNDLIQRFEVEFDKKRTKVTQMPKRAKG